MLLVTLEPLTHLNCMALAVQQVETWCHRSRRVTERSVLNEEAANIREKSYASTKQHPVLMNPGVELQAACFTTGTPLKKDRRLHKVDLKLALACRRTFAVHRMLDCGQTLIRS